jgi:hypothetical protein
MGLISKAWTNLAPPGAISPPDNLTRATRQVGRDLFQLHRDAGWRLSGHTFIHTSAVLT